MYAPRAVIATPARRNMKLNRNTKNLNVPEQNPILIENM